MLTVVKSVKCIELTQVLNPRQRFRYFFKCSLVLLINDYPSPCKWMTVLSQCSVGRAIIEAQMDLPCTSGSELFWFVLFYSNDAATRKHWQRGEDCAFIIAHESFFCQPAECIDPYEVVLTSVRLSLVCLPSVRHSWQCVVEQKNLRSCYGLKQLYIQKTRSNCRHKHHAMTVTRQSCLHEISISSQMIPAYAISLKYKSTIFCCVDVHWSSAKHAFFVYRWNYQERSRTRVRFVSEAISSSAASKFPSTRIKSKRTEWSPIVYSCMPSDLTSIIVGWLALITRSTH